MAAPTTHHYPELPETCNCAATAIALLLHIASTQEWAFGEPESPPCRTAMDHCPGCPLSNSPEFRHIMMLGWAEVDAPPVPVTLGPLAPREALIYDLVRHYNVWLLLLERIEDGMPIELRSKSLGRENLVYYDSERIYKHIKSVVAPDDDDDDDDDDDCMSEGEAMIPPWLRVVRDNSSNFRRESSSSSRSRSSSSSSSSSSRSSSKRKPSPRTRTRRAHEDHLADPGRSLAFYFVPRLAELAVLCDLGLDHVYDMLMEPTEEFTQSDTAHAMADALLAEVIRRRGDRNEFALPFRYYFDVADRDPNPWWPRSLRVVHEMLGYEDVEDGEGEGEGEGKQPRPDPMVIDSLID
ncbi:hypothetical protein B0T24DRAFT_712579 [Lasiosphaeria ovina]|uniref:Uncharacterized protein n=1 Tax=Lasiosphaeria ovina TaxID=92902 RepID=A0AAE0JW19_9PEZI|nr:hypothetical protein B0T24DRAFT_712579 [Lasiosphaeria ovina]